MDKFEDEQQRQMIFNRYRLLLILFFRINFLIPGTKLKF